MTRRPTPITPDQYSQVDGRPAGVDTTPLSFVQQLLQPPAGLSPPLPNIRRVAHDSLPANSHVVSLKY